MENAADVSLAQSKPKNHMTISAEALQRYSDPKAAEKFDRTKWGIINNIDPPATGEVKLFHLKLKHPVFFEAIIRQWEDPLKGERKILQELAKEHNLEKTPRTIPAPFTREFYSAMKEAGYSKFDPANLAKVHSRLLDIATNDYVEPRDAIAASKLVLQYNDMDVAQMQKQNKDMKDEIAMSEVKHLVSNLKKEFNKAKDVIIDADETSIS